MRKRKTQEDFQQRNKRNCDEDSPAVFFIYGDRNSTVADYVVNVIDCESKRSVTLEPGTVEIDGKHVRLCAKLKPIKPGPGDWYEDRLKWLRQALDKFAASVNPGDVTCAFSDKLDVEIAGTLCDDIHDELVKWQQNNPNITILIYTNPVSYIK